MPAVNGLSPPKESPEPGSVPMEPTRFAEIPTFELEKLLQKDPIQIAEAMADQGRRFGAIKIKMPKSYIETHQQRLQIDPDTFTFKTNQLLMNPDENEINDRLRFYHLLLKTHEKKGLEEMPIETPKPEEPLMPPVGESLSTEMIQSEPVVKEETHNGIDPVSAPVSETPLQVEPQAPVDSAALIAEPALLPQPLASPAAHELAKFPMLDKRPLDLYVLFKFVVRRGGYNNVINKKLWAQIGRDLGYKGKITSSVSSSLRTSYGRILFPLELHLGSKIFEFVEAGFPDTPTEGQDTAAECQDSPSKRRKLNTSAPLILGSAAEFSRSIRTKAAKGIYLNDPSLIDLKTPMVVAMRDAKQEVDSKKTDRYVVPIGAAAQVNSSLKWLATLLPILQDSSRLERNSKTSTVVLLRQFLERDSRVQEYLLHRYKDLLTSEGPASPEILHKVFMSYLYDKSEEFSRLENCPMLDLPQRGLEILRPSSGNSPSHMNGGGHGAPGEMRSPEAKGPPSPRVIADPFDLANLPFLPDSIMSALQALDLENPNSLHSHLNLGLTFSVEGWKCEDHFTQLASMHFYGKPKQWLFIPELQFEKFEKLVEDTVQTEKAQSNRLMLNYDPSAWDFSKLINFTQTEGDKAKIQAECIRNSLENILNPYPETRENLSDAELRSLTRQSLTRLNQDIWITPQMLSEHGIDFNSTIQEEGEMVLKYPKTFSTNISFGFSASEQVHFASKLWLKYAREGELWLGKQNLLPNFLLFKLLANYPSLLDPINDAQLCISDQVLHEVLDLFSEMIDDELAARKYVRKNFRMKEVGIEERHIADTDANADDDFLLVFPTKVMIIKKSSGSRFAMSLATFKRYLEDAEKMGHSDNGPVSHVLKDSGYSLEMHLFYLDEKLKGFQRSLRNYSLDFTSWQRLYEEIMESRDKESLRIYKALLQEGQEIAAALSDIGDTYGRFLSPDYAEHNRERLKMVDLFKKQLRDLEAFVDESNAIIEQCQAIISLKHQQRIRNGGTETVAVDLADHHEARENGLKLLVELVNVIPSLNFYAPEFDAIYEYKNEIQNFDRACRALIQQEVCTIPELDDMISLGTSFGVKIPSLSFIKRLRDRLKWCDTYEIIVSGGDPFSNRKDIFSLNDLRDFHDLGLASLSADDVDRLKCIDEFLVAGESYDAMIKAFVAGIETVMDVDLEKLDNLIVDMEDRSKMKGTDRLFVVLQTYQQLVDIKAQEPVITFLQLYSTKTHELFGVLQMLTELEKCSISYDSLQVKEDVAQTESWLKNASAYLDKARAFKSRSSQSSKYVCDAELFQKISLLVERCSVSLANNSVDTFENSSPYTFFHNLSEEGGSPIRYCLCREFEEGTMIECDTCHEWFHVSCVSAVSEIGEEDDNYSCPACNVLREASRTGEVPNWEIRIKDSEIQSLITQCEELRIRPKAEYDELQSLLQITKDALAWPFDAESKQRREKDDLLFKMFLFRKFFGSPILIESVTMDLIGDLKNADGVFDQKKELIPADGATQDTPSNNMQMSGVVVDEPPREEYEMNHSAPAENSAKDQPELSSNYFVANAGEFRHESVQSDRVENRLENRVEPAQEKVLVAVQPFEAVTAESKTQPLYAPKDFTPSLPVNEKPLDEAFRPEKDTEMENEILTQTRDLPGLDVLEPLSSELSQPIITSSVDPEPVAPAIELFTDDQIGFALEQGLLGDGMDSSQTADPSETPAQVQESATQTQ